MQFCWCAPEISATQSAVWLVFLGGLLFFEKAAVIPFVAFAVAALLGYVAG